MSAYVIHTYIYTYIHTYIHTLNKMKPNAGNIMKITPNPTNTAIPMVSYRKYIIMITTYTYIHTYIHSYIYTYIHIHTYITNMHTHTRAHAHTHIIL